MLRNTLIVIQFGISIMVISLALLMNTQLNFIIDKDLGFQKENVLFIHVKDNKLKSRVANLKNELISYSGIKAVSFSYSAPCLWLGAGTWSKLYQPHAGNHRAS